MTVYTKDIKINVSQKKKSYNYIKSYVLKILKKRKQN